MYGQGGRTGFFFWCVSSVVSAFAVRYDEIRMGEICV